MMATRPTLRTTQSSSASAVHSIPAWVSAYTSSLLSAVVGRCCRWSLLRGCQNSLWKGLTALPVEIAGLVLLARCRFLLSARPASQPYAMFTIVGARGIGWLECLSPHCRIALWSSLRFTLTTVLALLQHLQLESCKPSDRSDIEHDIARGRLVKVLRSRQHSSPGSTTSHWALDTKKGTRDVFGR